MRITDEMMYNTFIYNANNVNDRMLQTSEEMSSGRRLLDLSSDPVALSQLLSLKDLNKRIEQYKTNINNAMGILNVEDTSLGDMDDLITKASSMLIEGSNATNSSDSREAVAKNIQGILDELENAANTIFEGKYLFGGYKTDVPPIQSKTQSAAVLYTDNTDVALKTTEVFSDLNQLKSGDYTVVIEDNKLSLLDSSGNVVPIDADGEDESGVGGNRLSMYVNVSGKKGEWINTGRGLMIRVPTSIPATGAHISISYQAGGEYLYEGDDGAIDTQYADYLTSPVTITAKDILKPTDQTLENNNYLSDKTTTDAAVAQTRLTDVALNSALKNVALEVGYSIEVRGEDHNGNLVRGDFVVTSNATLGDLASFVEHLDAYEVLRNNKVLTANDKAASAGTTLYSLGITSNVVVNGFTHTGTYVSVVFANSPTATLGSFASFIGYNFDASSVVNHGQIVVSDDYNGPSKLSVRAKTLSGDNPVFGAFNAISHGDSGGFNDTVRAYVKDGHLMVKDERPGKSKMNVSFTVKDADGNVKPNVFGIFNTVEEGGGVDVFKTLKDAVDTFDGVGESNQVGVPTDWQAGSTLKASIGGTYLDGINDTWTVSVVKGGSLDLTNPANYGNTVELEVSSKNTSDVNKTIATVDITIDSDGTYTIETRNKDGVLIYKKTGVKNLDGIVLETKDPSPGFSGTGVNGTPGLMLNLDDIPSLPPVLNQGDSFSFDVVDSIQKAIEDTKESLNQILASRSVVGSITNRFQLAKNRIETTTLSNDKTISDLEDANIAKVFTQYQQELVALQATLQVGANLSRLNLFRYL